MKLTNPSAAFYPPPSSLATAGAIFGFRPGDSFESSAHAFRVVAGHDFESPPSRTEGRAQQFTLRRSAGAGEADAALYFVFDKAGHLVKVSLTFAGGPADSPASAAASARGIQAFLRGAIGPEAVFVDRIGEWSRGTMHTSTPEIAYAAAWSPGHTAATQVLDGSGFEETVATLGSAVTTALVACQKNLVMVMLIAEGAVAAS
jgi:hypothetical protein